LRSQTREIIGRVTDFMKNEAEEGVQIPIANFKERILKATRIGKTAYESIAKEKKKIHSGEKKSVFDASKRKVTTLGYKPSRKCEKKTIQQLFYDFHVVEKRRPTLAGNIIV
jgi:hypothetical protein